MNLNRFFDGKTLNGWRHSNNWTVADGAITWDGPDAQECIWTEGDYGSVRIFISSRNKRLVTPGSSHVAVLLWGDRPEDDVYRSRGFISVMPPFGGMWNYKTDKGIRPSVVATIEREPERDVARCLEWTKSEILANIKTGTIRLACDGVELVRYTHPNIDELKIGPIGLQQHYDGVVQYKDISIEIDPAEPDRLLTTQPS